MHGINVIEDGSCEFQGHDQGLPNVLFDQCREFEGVPASCDRGLSDDKVPCGIDLD